jgi:hypothetical protein
MRRKFLEQPAVLFLAWPKKIFFFSKGCPFKFYIKLQEILIKPLKAISSREHTVDKLNRNNFNRVRDAVRKGHLEIFPVVCDEKGVARLIWGIVLGTISAQTV